jgi:acetyltransferase-like isoleucine patch superfamily enzyme
MKGVTVGEGAIIGVNSVVVNDIPAYAVAMRNLARVVVKNIKTAEPTSMPSITYFACSSLSTTSPPESMEL